MSVRLEEIAARVAAGGRPTDLEAEALVVSHDLVTIGMIADDCRRRRHGRRTTFVRVARYPPGPHPPADAVPDPAREVRIEGAPPSVAAAVETVRALAPLAAGRPLTGFSLADLADLAAREGAALADVARRLREAGLEAVADVPVDRLADAARAVEAVRTGGLEARTLTVHRMDSASPLETIRRAVALQADASGFLAFAPLARTIDPEAPSTGYDDVKQVALARLLADNIGSIQIDWRGYGPKLAQVALTVGADDVDGVAPSDGDAPGARRAPLEEIRRNIRAAALDPVERDGRFAVIDA
jgi:aminodeoxyfutalosine synthase